MEILSIAFLLFVMAGVIFYYIVPKSWQWKVLLLWSVFFYLSASAKAVMFLTISVLTTYYAGIWIEKREQNKKTILIITVLCNVLLFVFLKYVTIESGIFSWLLHKRGIEWDSAAFQGLIPMGISFYTLMAVGYVADIYHKKIEAEKNLAKYTLFLIFFPHILQGPIGRYQELKTELFSVKNWNGRRCISGMELMIYGYFKKMVLADRAAIFVNQVYGNADLAGGCEIYLAGILYSIQLYMDFSGCVDISRGVSQLYGIRLSENFNHPYFAVSVKDFWRRWHMTLSSWLRDYIYIPLGGNRHGSIAKYLNLLLTFSVSGIWHGKGLHFFVWGLLHAVYQIFGEILLPIRTWIKEKLQISDHTFGTKLLQVFITFHLVNFAWIFFRIESVTGALYMIRNMFTRMNPWAFFDQSLYGYGLGARDFTLLFLGITGTFLIELIQYKKPAYLTKKFHEQHGCFRYGVVMFGIFSIIIFGIYGMGYDPGEFIYGQF